MPDTPQIIGTGRAVWTETAEGVTLADRRPEPRTLRLPARPVPVTFDAARAALVVVDMQNAFCAPGGLTDLAGRDLAPVRAPIAPLAALLPLLRSADIPVVWLNWGNRPDRLNLPPKLLQAFDPSGLGRSIGDELPGGHGPVLLKDSWSAAVVYELRPDPRDLHVDKYRISGFWDTPLDSIFRNLDIRTLLFAGVNLDVCVYHTLADAHCLGYDCLLLEDCCGTTAPSFCTEAALFNVQKCFGFVIRSDDLVTALAVR